MASRRGAGRRSVAESGQLVASEGDVRRRRRPASVRRWIVKGCRRAFASCRADGRAGGNVAMRGVAGRRADRS